MKKNLVFIVLITVSILISGCLSNNELANLPVSSIQQPGVFTNIDFLGTGGLNKVQVREVSCSWGGYKQNENKQSAILSLNFDASKVNNFQEDEVYNFIDENIFLLYYKGGSVAETMTLSDKGSKRVTPKEILITYDTRGIIHIHYEIPNNINVFSFNIIREDKIEQFLAGCN